MISLLKSVEKQENEDSGNFLLERAVEEIRRSLKQHLTVSKLATRLEVSREHLSRTFRKKYGISTNDFILKTKIEEARKLLLNTDLSCKEIAAQLGFSSAPRFTEVFRRITTLTPTQLRNKMR